MRRKLKLFSAIASLCLAVALMAFGVYAASQVTYTLNGSVTYDVSNVLVKITGRYTESSSTFANVTDPKTLQYSGTSHNLTGADYSNDYTGTEQTPSDDVNVAFGTYSAVKIEVTVTNYSKSYAVDIEETVPTVETTSNYAVVADDANVDTIAAATTEAVTPVTLTYYVYLLDVTKNVTNGDFDLVIKLTRGASV